MPDVVDALQILLDGPATAPPPVAQLHDRVAARRRRRGRRRAALAGLAVTAAAIVVVPLVDRPTTGTTRIMTGPDGSSSATTTMASGFVAGESTGARVDFQIPDGWEVLHAVADRLVVATRPLSERDVQLALLARADAAFIAFPSDGVVVVVGGDPLEAKYGTARDGTPIDPGPAYALGAERVLAGGVKTRHGDIPQSPLRIALYAGPIAPGPRVNEAEKIVAGLRLVPTGDPSVLLPPPPAGSGAGVPDSPLPVAEAGLPEVARVPAGGSTLVMVAGSDCAYLRWVDAQTTIPAYHPLAGGCATRRTGAAIETVGPTVNAVRPTGSPVAVMFRAGPGVRSVSARLADGRTVGATLGSDGWGVAAGDGRIVALVGIDAAGGASETPVR